MSWCMMPLVIKVKMTEQNYIKLKEEATKIFFAKYVDKYYKFDGEYFKLDLSNNMDDNSIYKEADMIAQYATATDEQVGFIFQGGCSYCVGDLYFKDKKIHMVNKEYPPMDWFEIKEDFQKRKRAFWRKFHKK